MERVIALLREKNHCLEKFYWLNEQELINLGAGNFDSVEEFYQAREQILNQIKCMESMLSEVSARVTAEVTVTLREEAAMLLKSKDEVVKSILAQDLQILVYIEKEKSNIIRELRANKQAKRAVGAYANTERIRALEGD